MNFRNTENSRQNPIILAPNVLVAHIRQSIDGSICDCGHIDLVAISCHILHLNLEIDPGFSLSYLN